MEVAALVLGIISLVSSVFSSFLGLGSIGSVCGILGIIFGAIGLKSEGTKKSQAKAGLILGIIALSWKIIIILACLTFF